MQIYKKNYIYKNICHIGVRYNDNNYNNDK